MINPNPMQGPYAPPGVPTPYAPVQPVKSNIQPKPQSTLR